MKTYTKDEIELVTGIGHMQGFANQILEANTDEAVKTEAQTIIDSCVKMLKHLFPEIPFESFMTKLDEVEKEVVINRLDYDYPLYPNGMRDH